jgi:hypothetical protein
MNGSNPCFRFLLRLLVCAAILVPLAAPAVHAQTLRDSVIALYPPEAGELAFADLHTLRQSPHYKVLHDSYLPSRVRDLERQALSLGIDFEAQAQQLSWAYLASPSGGVELLSIAEGNFAPSTVFDRARNLKLVTSEVAGQTLLAMGQNDAGQAFALAFPDPGKMVYGARDQVEALLTRAAQGSPGFLQNQTLAALLLEANGRSTIWSVMDQRFAVLEIRSIAPDITGRPEAQTILNSLKAAVARATLTQDLSSNATFLCTDPSQAALLAAVAQAGFALYATQEANVNPDLASTLRAAVVTQSGERVDLKLDLSQSQVGTLLAKSLPAGR